VRTVEWGGPGWKEKKGRRSCEHGDTNCRKPKADVREKKVVVLRENTKGKCIEDRQGWKEGCRRGFRKTLWYCLGGSLERATGRKKKKKLVKLAGGGEHPVTRLGGASWGVPPTLLGWKEKVEKQQNQREKETKR